MRTLRVLPPRKPILMNLSLKTPALATAALLLAACGGLGEGNRPQSLAIVEAEALSLRSAEDAIEVSNGTGTATACLGKQLQLLITFTDGSIGSFTGRANWSSDNPTVVDITNQGETLHPDGSGNFLPGGVLLPAAGGTARITAEYQGLTQVFDVTVETLDAGGFTMTPAEVTMSANSGQNFTVEVSVGGETRDVTSSLYFELDDPSELGQLSGGGAFSVPIRSETAAPLPADITIHARPLVDVPACTSLAPSAIVHAGALNAVTLALDPDFYGAGAAPGENRLIDGFSQLLQVTGTFADLDGDGSPDTQDLSRQFAVQVVATDAGAANCETAFEIPDSEDDTVVEDPIVGFGSILAARTAQVFGVNPGTVGLCGRFGSLTTDGDTFVTTAAPIVLEVIPGLDAEADAVTLATSDLVITPGSASIDTILGTTPFTARANFVLPDASTLSHDVTDSVLWTVDSDESGEEERRVAEIFNSGSLSGDAGVAISRLLDGDDPATVNVNARVIVGTVDTDPVTEGDPADIEQSAQLSVSAPPLP